ncbi:hypothetical protein BKI52_22555 [marine bacterium AO1-C]|nr:hypothetical protein BKI52_22555 [marine bacterium AO1-C]
MKIKSAFLNPLAYNTLLFAFMISQSFAQHSPKTTFDIRPVSIGINPQVKCKHFSASDSAKAVEYANRFRQHYTHLFDSLAQVNPGFVLLRNAPANADLQLTIQIGHIKKDGGSFATFNGELSQSFRVIHQASGKKIIGMSINSQGFQGFDDAYYNSVKSFSGPHFLRTFLGNFAPTHTILKPKTRKATNEVILQQFTTNNKKLQSIALMLNHLANNTLAFHQNKQMELKGDTEAPFRYNFKYTPNYSLKQQATLAFDNKQVFIQGKLITRGKKYYELQLRFIGEDVQMTLIDTPVETSLLLRKDLIDSGNYSEAIIKVNESMRVFVFANYR